MEVQKSDYSQIAEYYDKVRTLPADILLSKIIAYGKIDKDCTVLDVGCGTGRFSLNLSATKNFTLCALEPSIEMLKQAIKKDEFKRILWVRGDGQHLPFRENLFNCIYMTSVIHHIENKEKAIREMHRALKPNSRCVIMTYSQTRLRKHTIHHFPGIVAIDLKRIPPIPLLKRIMTETGFKGVTYHVAKHDEGYVPIDAYLERVRNKYISTLTLLSEDNFQRGFKIFEKRIRRKYLDRIRRISWFVFVVGQK